MSNINIDSKKNLLLAAFLGATICYGFHYLLTDDSSQHQKIISLENRIKDLELSLMKKDDELENKRLFRTSQNKDNNLTATTSLTATPKPFNAENNENGKDQAIANISTPDSVQVLKDLGTHSENDPRSFAEKVNDFLASDLTKEKIAIVSKSIFDMASDRENLPDYALQSIYHNQTDLDLKRVIAQVASLRGNNMLIETQITETQLQLKSTQPTDRQAALSYLAKTHNANAANAIAPLLQDPDINVKLDALLALRATGNQTHISLVEKLLNDPEPAVSSLASDVISNLKNLSESARTTLASADIAAELPPLENP